MTPADKKPANPAQVTDALTAAVVALARHGIEPDVQSLLIDGNPSRGIRPGAINAALTAAIGAGNPAQVTDAMVEAAKEAVWNTDSPEYMRDYLQYDNIMRAALAAAIGAGGQAVAVKKDSHNDSNGVE